MVRLLLHHYRVYHRQYINLELCYGFNLDNLPDQNIILVGKIYKDHSLGKGKGRNMISGCGFRHQPSMKLFQIYLDQMMFHLDGNQPYKLQNWPM